MFQKIISQALAESELKSWEKQQEVFYNIKIKRGSGFQAEWFERNFYEQSKKMPSGITRERAKEIAGIGGRIFRVIVESERIQ